MKKTTIVGYPRIGVHRELKFAVEDYFKGNITSDKLLNKGKELRKEYWNTEKYLGINIIPSNDFSYYDNMLDTAFLINAIPKRYKELNLNLLDTYFAMARGYQKDGIDVKAQPMKKWFNTNYHYIVPELDDDIKLVLKDEKIIDLYLEAKDLGIETKPTVIGPFTFIKLAHIQGKKDKISWVLDMVEVYKELLLRLNNVGAKYIQIEEPILVTDLSQEDKKLFEEIYNKLLDAKCDIKVILQTYFGDIRDIYKEIINMKFDAVGLDFVEGKKSFDLIKKYGFPKDKYLFAGVVNGKNIWKNDYKRTMELLKELESLVGDKIVISSSCSLLHVPYTVKNENNIENKYKESLAFAEEKLVEIEDIRNLLEDKNYSNNIKFISNQKVLENKKNDKVCFDKEVREKISKLTKSDFFRNKPFEERRAIQKKIFNLGLLPTTTIGSFPQTSDVKKARKSLRLGEISEEEYDTLIKKKIKDIIKFQEDIGLDVLVHGEYERNDMVEYFGKLLDGFIFTDNGWVQSYGTRGVKPPIIYGDIKRSRPLTVKWSKYAQSLTKKCVKGMLTGPITILNWSFPREDLQLKEIAYEIGLAIGEEVLELEKEGIKIIQIDEAALREKLPLRKDEWNTEYLDWAIPAFRLTNSKVKDETQIHTHMCYSEFTDIIKAIEDMDADVISIEAARSDFSLLDFIKSENFKLEIGPGVYDIHSPRVPSKDEIINLINIMKEKIDIDKLWINPDCGLKTRGEKETKESLVNLVEAAKDVREKLK